MKQKYPLTLTIIEETSGIKLRAINLATEKAWKEVFSECHAFILANGKYINTCVIIPFKTENKVQIY